MFLCFMFMFSCWKYISQNLDLCDLYWIYLSFYVDFVHISLIVFVQNRNGLDHNKKKTQTDVTINDYIGLLFISRFLP